jgi:ferredoxin-type protein NapF
MARIKSALTPGTIRAAVSAATLIVALPIGLKGATGIFIWLSPFVMLNSVIILKSFVVLNAAGIIILLASFFRKRIFCRYLCPAGFCLDKISEKSSYKATVHKKLPPLGSILALISVALAFTGIPLLILLDPQAVFHGFLSVLSGKTGVAAVISLCGFPALLALNYFFPHLWCNKICPLGGIQDLATDIRSVIPGLKENTGIKNNKSGYLPARRYFLASGAGLAAGAVLSKVIRIPSAPAWLRPPASTDPDVFNTLCIRCGNCIKSCPSGIITHHDDFSIASSWLTPEVVFEKGYCIEKCNVCSQVCPSGSITLFSPESKSRIFMGSALVFPDKCLLSKNRECDRCRAACSYKAVIISKTEDSITMKPEILIDKCVGCGACKVICPVAAIKILPPSAV